MYILFQCYRLGYFVFKNIMQLFPPSFPQTFPNFCNIYFLQWDMVLHSDSLSSDESDVLLTVITKRHRITQISLSEGFSES